MNPSDTVYDLLFIVLLKDRHSLYMNNVASISITNPKAIAEYCRGLSSDMPRPHAGTKPKMRNNTHVPQTSNTPFAPE